jgi:hypothetical protein
MAFKGDGVALFGGRDSGSPTAKLFGDTWTWDGEHWTQRQDIGPDARWLPAIAFDGARGHLVLFGGGTTVGPPVTGLSGETWEHSDTGASGPPPPAAVEVASVTAQPADLAVGDTTTVTVTFTGTAPPGGLLQVAWAGAGLPDLTFGGQPLDQYPLPLEVDASGTADIQFDLQRFQNSIAAGPGDTLATIGASFAAPPQQVELHAL